MIHQLITIDKELMVMLNLPGQHTAFADSFMWLTSQPATWIVAYAVLLGVCIKVKKKESIAIILFAALAILLCDQTASGILKPLVARLRPSHDPSIMDMLSYVGDYRGATYGFPSSHASNCFGIAIFFALILKNEYATASLYLYAFICAYSRIYLGVHFPGDVTVGAIIGTILGWLCYIIYDKTRATWFKRLTNNGHFERFEGLLAAGSIVGTFAVIVIVSALK